MRPVASGVNEYIVDPANKYVVDPATKYVVDPVAKTAPQFYRTGDLQKIQFLLFNFKCGQNFIFDLKSSIFYIVQMNRLLFKCSGVDTAQSTYHKMRPALHQLSASTQKVF